MVGLISAPWLRELDDNLFDSFLRAESEAEADRCLTELLLDCAMPLIRVTISRQLRAAIPDGLDDEIVEDLQGLVLLKLLTELRSRRLGVTARTVENFRGYVYSMARHACHDFLRERYPRIRQLQDSLRYWFSHHPNLEIWESDGIRVCGYQNWRREGREPVDAKCRQGLHETLSAKPYRQSQSARRQQQQLTMFIESALTAAQAPLAFSALIRLLADWMGIPRERAFIESGLDETMLQRLQGTVRTIPGSVTEIEQKLYLAKVWECVAELQTLQRRALLLNLRSGSERGLIVSLCDLKIATIPQLAELLEIPLSDFLELWSRLPLNDDDIAALFEITRQQVVNHRSAARRHLASLLSGTKSGDP